MTYASKPSQAFSWATAPSGGTSLTQPINALALAGYGDQNIPTAENFNWIFNLIGGWTAYLNTLDATVLPYSTVFGDLWGDYVVSGNLPAVSANLTTNLPAWTAYVLGQRVTPAAESITVVASQDTYFDLSSAGVWTQTGVANGSGAPAVAANSVRQFVLISSGTAITSVTDDRVLIPNAKAGQGFNPATAHTFTAQQSFQSAGSQVTFGTAASQGYLFGQSTAADITFGADYEGGQWLARVAAPSLISAQTGQIVFYADTGKTVGNAYVPTQVGMIDNTGKFSANQFSGGGLALTSVVHNHLRQVVLQAAQTSGVANWLTGSGAALTAGYLATATPARLTFANGYNADGTPADPAPLLITADNASAWTGLVANTTNYLFIQNNNGTPVPVSGLYPQMWSTVAPWQPYNPPAGATATWHMDEAAGSTAADSAGTYTGTATGTTIVAGIVGAHARSFNGTSDLITVTGNPVSDTGNFTIAAWLNVPTPSTGANKYIIQRGWSSNVSPYSGWEWQVHSSGKLYFTRAIGAAGAQSLLGNNVLPAGTPVHVAITYNNTSGACVMYVNGQVDNSATFTTGTVAYTAGYDHGTIIGANANSGDAGYFNGVIDEIYVYPSVLTQAQIQSLQGIPNGARWFDPIQSKAFVASTGTWAQELCVPVGEAVTNATNVTSIISYALRGYYDSGWFPVTLNANYSKAHNIGIPASQGVEFEYYFSPTGSDNDAVVAHDYLYSSAGYGHLPLAASLAGNPRNNIGIGFFNDVQLLATSAGGSTGYTSGYYRIIGKRIA